MDQEEVKLVLKQMLELLNDRPDDMYDEEGFPTEELNVLVGRMKQIVSEMEE
jgi:hypothetical protein